MANYSFFNFLKHKKEMKENYQRFITQFTLSWNSKRKIYESIIEEMIFLLKFLLPSWMGFGSLWGISWGNQVISEVFAVDSLS
jgi:hypothetical protein